ncbi:LOW QUALITY PROTEIN: protein SPMIP2 [Theristicus caerulescens]
MCDYRTRKPEHTHYRGATSPAIEGTSDVNYLWCLPPRPSYVSPRRPRYPGDIGWGMREPSHFTRKPLQSGVQIQQPAPYILEQQGHHARARLAWDLGSYRGCLHPCSKRAAMIWASQAPLLSESKGKLVFTL